MPRFSLEIRALVHPQNKRRLFQRAAVLLGVQAAAKMASSACTASLGGSVDRPRARPLPSAAPNDTLSLTKTLPRRSVSLCRRFLKVLGAASQSARRSGAAGLQAGLLRPPLVPCSCSLPRAAPRSGVRQHGPIRYRVGMRITNKNISI